MAIISDDFFAYTEDSYDICAEVMYLHRDNTQRFIQNNYIGDT